MLELRQLYVFCSPVECLVMSVYVQDVSQSFKICIACGSVGQAVDKGSLVLTIVHCSKSHMIANGANVTMVLQVG